MPLSLLIGFAGVFGVSEGIKASQAKGRREEHRSRKNNLKIHCLKSSQFSPYLEGRSVVLSGDRLYADTNPVHGAPFGHPFEGYYLPYPESRFSGLVSSITDSAPIMNWIFINRYTYQMSFGVRVVSDGHLTGPWDCTRQEKRLTFAGWEGFCAVLEDGGVWGLYFDVDGDALLGKLGPDRVVIEIELQRKEMRMRKPVMRAQLPPAPTPAPEPQPAEAATDSTRPEKEAGDTAQPSDPAPAPREMPEKIRTELDSEGGSTRVGTPSEGSRAQSPTSSQGQPDEDGMLAKEGKARPVKYKQPSVENSDEEEQQEAGVEEGRRSMAGGQ